VAELRLLGHDILTVEEAGKANLQTPDLEILEFAISAGRAVLTLNRRHFIHLHSRRPMHRGIIVCTTDSDFSGQATRIHQELASAGSLDGQLIRVNRRSQ
jgi:predicted nuclease of predicted toxin-antitoxin system